MNRSNGRMLIRGCCAMAGFLIALTSNAQTAASPQSGDEIVVCGERFHTGTRIVLWSEPGGYDFHYTTAPVGTPEERKPHRVRMSPLTDEQIGQIRQNGWTPELLRQYVDQFVIHYSVDPTSRDTFNTLVKRHLSVQFMLDLDGTIYQTMDAQEEAPHATKANGRSVGIEIANLGGRNGGLADLKDWYKKENGKTVIKIPAKYGDGGIRNKDIVLRPARPNPIKGIIQGKTYEQYDFTPQQYNALIHLTAALCTAFPKITLDYPRQKLSFGVPSLQMDQHGPASHPDALATLGEPGILIPHALSDEQYDVYQGLLGHYHVQTDKQDPGPAFQWDTLVNGARKLMTPEALTANSAARGKPARFIPSAPVHKQAAK